MNYKWIVLCFLYLFNNAIAIYHLKNIISGPKSRIIKNIEHKDDLIVFIEDWSCGEIQWEFAQNDEQKIYTFLIPENTKIELNEKDLKKNMKGSLLLTSGFIKAVYKDTMNIENIANKLQNIDYLHLTSEAGIIDLFSVSFIGLIYFGYKKSIQSELKILQNQKNNDEILTLQEIKNYIIMQRIFKTFILCFIFIFTKNIKPAE
jgi:hypothetical protein